MLHDCQLVPQTIVRPKSFVGLMALYESNYLRLLRLIPELHRLDGCYRSTVAGDCDLHLEIIERSRYTVTMTLSYVFGTENGPVADPDMLIRVYLDGQMAEAMRDSGKHGHDALQRLSKAHCAELDSRWRRNIILSKWSEYLMDQGHLILER